MGASPVDRLRLPAGPSPRRIVVTDAAQLGYALLRRRLALRVTAPQLAARLKIAKSSVSRRETGRTTFRGLDDMVSHAAAIGYRIVLERIDDQ